LITVYETSTINVTPRNLFSPNGDGVDDFWVIESIENYPGAEVTIYNANGRIVYEKKNYNNEWNAVYEGKDLPETAYFFVIRYENKDPKTGSVTIIR
jgi:gliding motility-associated-like protein